MWIVNILCIISINVMISKCFKYSFSKALPITCAALIGMLFVLSVFNIFHWIDYFSICVVLWCIAFIIKTKSFTLKDSAEIVLMLFIIVTIFFCCKGHVAHHSDELNYWGLETKAIFFLNGFSEKGKDAAYLYSDYHPGLVLFMWWFCHLSPNSFSEGLMYTGYWVMFAIPIISIIGSKATYKKIPSLYIVLLVTILFVPSTVNGINYESITAELPMASFFALLVFELFNINDEVRNIQYCSVLVLMLALLKKSGLLWAIIALLIGFIRNKNLRLLVVPAICGFAWTAIWKLYCLVMDRSGYFSTDIVNTVNEIKWGGFRPFLLECEKYARSYLQAFIFEPLHTSNNGIINITPVIFCIMVLVLILMAIQKKFIQRKDGIILLGSYFTLQFIFSIAMIFMCTFVFRESQYYNPNHMVNHFISRYGIPFYLSALIMAIFAIFSGWREFDKPFKIISVVGALLFIGSCADWHTINRTVIHSDYFQDTQNQIRAEVEEKYGNILSNNMIDRAVIIEGEENDNSKIERYYIRYSGAPKQLFFIDGTDIKMKDLIIEVQQKYNTSSIFYYDF